MPTPCPHCGRQPEVEQCGPWPRNLGKAPWYVGCYQSGEREHFVGGNDETKDAALAQWERMVAFANRHQQ